MKIHKPNVINHVGLTRRNHLEDQLIIYLIMVLGLMSYDKADDTVQ